MTLISYETNFGGKVTELTVSMRCGFLWLKKTVKTYKMDSTEWYEYPSAKHIDCWWGDGDALWLFKWEIEREKRRERLIKKWSEK